MTTSAHRIPPTVVAAVVLAATRSALNAWVAVTQFGATAMLFALIGISIPLGLCLLVLLGDWRARLVLSALFGFAAARLVPLLIADTYGQGQTSGTLAAFHPAVEIAWALVVIVLLFLPNSRPWFTQKQQASAPTP